MPSCASSRVGRRSYGRTWKTWNERTWEMAAKAKDTPVSAAETPKETPKETPAAEPREVDPVTGSPVGISARGPADNPNAHDHGDGLKPLLDRLEGIEKVITDVRDVVAKGGFSVRKLIGDIRLPWQKGGIFDRGDDNAEE